MISYDFEQKVNDGILKLNGTLLDEDAPDLKIILNCTLSESSDLVIDLCNVDSLAPKCKQVLEEVLERAITQGNKNLHLKGKGLRDNLISVGEN